MEERGLVGLEARATDGEILGRISALITDERSGEVTHVIVERGEEKQIEMPISSLTLDPEADFARFHTDPSDEEPGDHLGDAERPQGYAPAQSDAPNDYEHEGQFVTTPQDPDEAQSAEELERQASEASGYEDEGTNTADSGYPRNDAYINPDTGEEELDPAMKDNETLADDVENLINGTELGVRAAKDGVVELTGRATSQEDLEGRIEEIMGLDGVLEVDTTDVDFN
ncbi:MAG TPA: PRC-barrel domain-containing protein [Rubrobacteraceae bacterium]|nr:PRC-barrel domain-containing protein [Rubrobacteraceae bacterium]